jgi:hypothetical protein
MANESVVRAARYLIEAHGSAAAGIAERRAHNLAIAGAALAADTWRRIANVVRMLQPRRPKLALVR